VLSLTSQTKADIVLPDWFDQNDYDFGFSGNVGGSDIDRVEPGHHSILGSLDPGQEWVAWLANDSMYMTSWEGYNQGGDQFVGLLDSVIGTNSELGAVLIGNAQSDGGIYICLSGNNDPLCAKNGGSINTAYTFKVAFGPEVIQVDEPPALLIFTIGLVGLAFAMRRRGKYGLAVQSA